MSARPPYCKRALARAGKNWGRPRSCGELETSRFPAPRACRPATTVHSGHRNQLLPGCRCKKNGNMGDRYRGKEHQSTSDNKCLSIVALLSRRKNIRHVNSLHMSEKQFINLCHCHHLSSKLFIQSGCMLCHQLTYPSFQHLGASSIQTC